MNALVVLALILFGLMVSVGGETGVFAFLSLFLNVVVFLAMTHLLAHDAPIFLTAFSSCLMIACINFFFVNNWDKRTQAAFMATLLVMALVCLLVPFLLKRAYIQGFAPEELEELSHFTLLIDLKFSQLSLALILVGMMGAVTDGALAVASAMFEIHSHQPTLTENELLRSGLRIGTDLLGTTLNTLLFAFLGSQLALLLWVKDLAYSLAQLVNSQLLVAELMTILLTGAGAVLILPLTAWLCAKWYPLAPN